MRAPVAIVLFLLCLAWAADELGIERVRRALGVVLIGVALWSMPTFVEALFALSDYEAAQVSERVVDVITKAAHIPSTPATTPPP